ncbi:LuxR family transcriptional regulator [Intrasporangium chromatireducens Q5-1]|uniref:LuxR family transcriptional regulator n=1 Tax=Intrasporangium chromatireducens Q5-1 TaxID=584657 RepID=W9GMN7_9MICO|nr:LuxR C-terminal-related transcriptional regulator [Intrasporangium chromatireducens]EWT06078.1 LuxR family transcriptional regulator [Intrasporangium chromatireducens Q5-1]
MDTRKIEETIVEAAVRTIESVSRAIGDAPSQTAELAADRTELLARLDDLEQKVAAGGSKGVAQHLSELARARADVLAEQYARQRSMVTRLGASLGALRTASTLDDFIESVPLQVTRLGYERSMFSWVRDEKWVPRSMYSLRGRDNARRALEAGGPPYRHVRELLEVDTVRNRRSLLVLDVAGNPRVHPDIIVVTQSTSYVVAPVVAKNHVVGLIHLDGSLEQTALDGFDRDLLSLFAQTVGAVLDGLLARPTSSPTSEDGPSGEWWNSLTKRELQVLRLVAVGLTNAQIGARLYVSEETIKSHVQQILRKLGVANRAQASALFHRALAAKHSA